MKTPKVARPRRRAGWNPAASKRIDPQARPTHPKAWVERNPSPPPPPPRGSQNVAVRHHAYGEIGSGCFDSGIQQPASTKSKHHTKRRLPLLKVEPVCRVSSLLFLVSSPLTPVAAAASSPPGKEKENEPVAACRPTQGCEHTHTHTRSCNHTYACTPCWPLPC